MSPDIICPTTEGELAQFIRDAGSPLTVIGGGTRPGGEVRDSTVLSTRALTGITYYDPGSLTLVAAAGTPVDEVQNALAAEGQHLPFEPMDHRPLLGTDGTPTLGGVIAGNISGPRRISAGAARDSLIGLRFVDGAGTVIKNGGRVMKNVTGYDLVKLMAGSWGTLGVMTELAFKVLPKPGTTAVLLLEGLSDVTAIETLTRALASPYSVSGAVHLPVGLDGDPVTMIRVEGSESSVSYRVGALKKLIPDGCLADVENDATRTDAGWAWVRDVLAFQDAPGDVWKLSVPPTDGPEIAARAGAEQVIYDWGGGLIWARVAKGSDLRARLGSFRGHATLVRASDETRARIPEFHPEAPALAQISAGLRAKFDPRGILNPGRMG